MTPNVSVSSSLSYAPRTVAMRKEANELRKSLKPLLEKRRRARINDSLNRLKALILPLTGKDQCRYSKLEKADILEMTVRFLTDIQSTQPKESSMSFEEGHNSCLQRALATLPQTRMDAESRQRVTEFLQRSVKPPTAACQNCCAQSSRLMSDIHQKLLHLKSSTARSVKAEESMSPGVERRRAAPLMADVWRPW